MLKNKVRIFILLFVSMLLVITYYRSDDHIKLTGIYWGAFDPPTEAHEAIIIKAINDIPLKKLIIVVNNHPYKSYSLLLENRLLMMKSLLDKNGLEHVELLWQDEAHPINFNTLSQISHEPLCAIAGYDSYQKWVARSSSSERACYDAIAVIPRGDEDPVLFDQSAFLLPIPSKYKYVSSTKVRELRSGMFDHP